jgi:hypothetical protein
LPVTGRKSGFCILEEPAVSIIRAMRPDGGSKHHWNVVKHLPDYTAQHPEDSHFHTRCSENLKFQHNFISNTVIGSCKSLRASRICL